MYNCLKVHWGRFMKIIPTGEMEAIQLDHIHSAEVLYLERTVGRVKAENGGFATVLIEWKRGLVSLIECTTSQMFHRDRSGLKIEN